ncbi:coiled-coil domain-containing protein [Citrobacter freundii]|uniref:hypothetical protein n=1 Tax=Citrobacter freundii TaxID=546 RepID=UPI001FF3B6C8|nr:hypothetical protein [Citrobacter freundii]EKX5204212.1 hypothetical protein [Citrobacter freundii]MCJ8533292.1 hypothetical protein [Citrobacter freundii]HCB1818425.1 hypothetical protein [Citrobacter freundii]
MSENLDKIIDTVKAVSTEPVMKAVNLRLSNPFFLCFISSWILCNWDRVLLLLFSFNIGIEKRIEKINSLPSNSVFWGVSIPHTHTFWYPFIASIFFVVGTPFVAYIVDILQNGVIAKKNKNDSLRKQEYLELKKAEITKNVEYENADAQARLVADQEKKKITFDTRALEKDYEELSVKLRDLKLLINERERESSLQNKTYNDILNSVSEVRKELEEKEQTLKNINGKIIAQQNKLDDIVSQISKSTIPLSINDTSEDNYTKAGLARPNRDWFNQALLTNQHNMTWPGQNIETLKSANEWAKKLSAFENYPGLKWPDQNLAALQSASEWAKKFAPLTAFPKLEYPEKKQPAKENDLDNTDSKSNDDDDESK